MQDAASQESTADAGGGQVKLPPIDLRQLLRLTDDTGMFQHALHQLPDPNHGYCIDDNCRALIAAVYDGRLRGYDPERVPLERYLGFVAYAFNEKRGRFRNFMSYDRRWLEEVGSEDSHARTIWSLGVTVRWAPVESIRELADRLFIRGLAATEQFAFIRPWAYTVLGLSEYLAANPDHAEVRERLTALAGRLFERWREHASDDWPWWEDELTWGNAKLPHALLSAAEVLEDPAMRDAGLKALDWCMAVQTAEDGRLTVIGNDGWFNRSGHRAQFDQQPIEAQGCVQACLAAARATGQRQWIERALRSFAWFTGDNDLGVPLYHPETGGCQDGLRPEGANKNQGAESALAYILSVLELHLHMQAVGDEMPTGKPIRPKRSLGLGVIGASGFAAFCLEQFNSIDELRPVGVWSRTDANARRFAGEHQLRSYGEIDQLLADDAIDVVHIATTPGTHAELAIKALAAGKHVLVEKPLATTAHDAAAMVDAAAAHERRLAVNMMMRYGPLVEPMLAVIGQGVLGAPLRGMLINRAGDSGLGEDHWFWDEKRSGGIFVEHGVHFFDLVGAMLHHAGRGQVVGAHELTPPGTGVIDQVACDVRYGEQTSVSFYHGFTQTDALDKQELRLIFERGQVTLHGWVARRLELHAVLTDEQVAHLEELFKGAEVTTLRRYEGDRPTVRRRGRDDRVDREVRLMWEADDDAQAVYGAAVEALMRDMVESIEDPTHTMRVSDRDGAAAVELALAARRAAKRAE